MKAPSSIIITSIAFCILLFIQQEPIAVRFATTDRPLGAYLYNASSLSAFPCATDALAE